MTLRRDLPEIGDVLRMQEANTLGAAVEILDELYACSHAQRIPTLRTIKGGSTHVVRQCIDCGHADSNPVSKSTVSDISALPPFNDGRYEFRRQMYYLQREQLVHRFRTKDAEFLQSYEWQRVRMFVLRRDGAKCACCGATPRTGAVMNVDHIKPRRTHPELALDPTNCQVLCNNCNKGKGNWDSTDWRDRRAQKLDEPNRTAGPYRELVRFLLQRPALVCEFTEELPKHPGKEARALTTLVVHLRQHATPTLTTGPLVESLQNTEFGTIYVTQARQIARLGDTGEDEAAFRDAMLIYRAFESKYARLRELGVRE